MKPPAARQTDEVKQTTKHPWRTRIRGVAVIAGYAYLALIAAVLASIWLGGDRWWWATVLLFGPRWPWLVPAIVVLPVLFALRHRVLPTCLFALLAYLLLGVQLPSLSLLRTAERQPNFSIVTMNVRGGDIRQQAFVKSWPQDVDAVFLQECRGDALEKIVPENWNRHLEENGVCIASPHPMLNIEALPRPHGQGWGASAIRCILNTKDGPVRLVGVHFESPRDGLEALLSKKLAGVDEMRKVIKERRQEAEAVDEWIRQWTVEPEAPLILAGDFNTPRESRNYQEHWTQYQDAFSVVGSSIGATWFSRWHGLRIDHILCDDSIKILSCHVGDDYGSDHLPLYAELKLSLRTGSSKPDAAKAGVE